MQARVSILRLMLVLVRLMPDSGSDRRLLVVIGLVVVVIGESKGFEAWVPF